MLVKKDNLCIGNRILELFSIQNLCISIVTMLHDTCCRFSYSIFFIPEKRFLALGFGGQVNGRVSHCFPLNGNSRDPYCRGIEGVVDAYYESLRHGKYINIMPLKKLKAIQFQK